MKYIRAKANFFRLADEKFIVVGARIIECMKTSAVFTDPTPTVAQLQKAYEDYYQAVVPAASRSRETQALKRERKRVLADLFQQLVYYINTVADGRLSLLYSSVFPVLNGKRTEVVPDIPTGIIDCCIIVFLRSKIYYKFYFVQYVLQQFNIRVRHALLLLKHEVQGKD